MNHLWLALLELGRFLIDNPWRTIAIVALVVLFLFLRAFSRAWMR